MKKTMLMLAVLLLTLSQLALASDDTRKMHGQHMHGPLHGNAKVDTRALNPPMEHLEGVVARKGIADDYTVVFHIMRAPEGMRYGKADYHLMVIVEKDGKPVNDLHIESIVTHPNRTLVSKPMVSMGDWYMALYDFNHEQGRHHISVHFTIADKNYSADTYYPETDFSQPN